MPGFYSILCYFLGIPGGSDSKDSEGPQEKGMGTHSSILAWGNPMDRGAWRATGHGVLESDTTEGLNTIIVDSLHCTVETNTTL